MDKLFIAAFLFAALCASAQDEGLVAKPIKYAFTLPSIKELPKNFSRYEEIGCEITYFVPGDGRMKIDDQSLTITSVTDKNGKNISFKDNRVRSEGTSSFTLDGATYTTFSIFIPTEAPPVEVPVVKGTITTQIKGKREAQFLTFKTDEKGVEQKAGPFSISVKEGDDFAIHLKGDRELLAELTLSAGDKKIQHRGTSSSTRMTNGVRTSETTYTYNKPTTPEFSLTVIFFTETQDIPITLGQE